MRRFLAALLALAVSRHTTSVAAEPPSAAPLPGTKRLTWDGDLAARLVAGCDKFLLRKLAENRKERLGRWKKIAASGSARVGHIANLRGRLAHILGAADDRTPFKSPALVATVEQPALIAESPRFKVFAIRWPAVGGIHGEGLLLIPKTGPARADIVAIPDADQTPEQIAGLAPGVPAESQFARRLAETGCRVVVPALVSREREKRRGRANLTHREYLYRAAFELGRHLIGYEVQKVRAAVDWFASEKNSGDRPIGVIGYGEGGMLALYVAALDERIDAVAVSGYFGVREEIWRQPISRNVFGLLRDFGDAELAAMILPRKVIIEAGHGPRLSLAGLGGAPAELAPPPIAAVKQELERVAAIAGDSAGNNAGENGSRSVGNDAGRPRLVAPKQFCGAETLAATLESLGGGKLAELGPRPKLLAPAADPAARQQRMVREIDRHNQRLLADSAAVRRKFMERLDTSSLAAYEKSVTWYREYFAEHVIGRFHDRRLPPNPRTRLWKETPRWTAYEVVLDLYPEVFAQGILVLPKGIEPGERRPVVICQHGLEGRPEQTIVGDNRSYHDFAARLAERGFITFAPQNIYIGGDRFRTLQRKANPLGKTLFSIMVPQHQQIVDWLKSLPQVDGRRIAFYGLSYGGKSAMRIPPLVTDYCLSICSADFNEWVDKNASTRNPRSYIWTGEYEIFEFNLGGTFNYAEMAALIAPRPFMVERGHFDGVADDWTVAWEFAKVRHLYAVRLKIPKRCRIEWFVGPHTINGQGTFEFLQEHLRWPKPKAAKPEPSR